MASLAELITSARESKGWTISELARQAEVDRAFVSRIEAGQLRGSAETQVRLARALDLDLGTVLAAAAGLPDDAEHSAA